MVRNDGRLGLGEGSKSGGFLRKEGREVFCEEEGSDGVSGEGLG